MNKLLLTSIATIMLTSVSNAKDGDLLTSLSDICTITSKNYKDYIQGGCDLESPFIFKSKLQSFKDKNDLKNAKDFVEKFYKSNLKGCFFTNDFDQFFKDVCEFVSECPSFLTDSFSGDIDSNCEIVNENIFKNIFKDTLPKQQTDTQIVKMALFGKMIGVCEAGIKGANREKIIKTCEMKKSLSSIRNKDNIIEKLKSLRSYNLIFHVPVGEIIDEIQ